MYSFTHSGNKLFILLNKEGVEYECVVTKEDIINLTKHNIRTTEDFERAFKYALTSSLGWTMVITDDYIHKLSYKYFFVDIDFSLEFVSIENDCVPNHVEYSSSNISFLSAVVLYHVLKDLVSSNIKLNQRWQILAGIFLASFILFVVVLLSLASFYVILQPESILLVVLSYLLVIVSIFFIFTIVYVVFVAFTDEKRYISIYNYLYEKLSYTFGHLKRRF